MYGFVAQLNEGRYSKKRPTEFRVDQVLQAFDPNKFNFTKAFKREVLFTFEPAPPGRDSSFEEAGRCNASPNIVLINVSPIDYGHVLLCPKVLDCIPQVLRGAEARHAWFCACAGAGASAHVLTCESHACAVPSPLPVAS